MTDAVSGVVSAGNTQKCMKMSEETKQKIDDKINDLQDIPDTFEKGGKVINDTLDTVNGTLKDTTGKVASLGITCAGLVTTAKKPFTSLLEWMKEPLRDDAGNVIKETLENGKEIIKKSEKFAKNKVIGVAVAGAVLVGSIVAGIIAKHVKNKKAQEVQAPSSDQTTEVKQEAETKEIEEAA